MKTVKGWKLFRLRADGTVGPLFINRKQVIPINKWLDAECHPTKGYAVRPGWHAAASPDAPHLSEKGRVWIPVELQGVQPLKRPRKQGGVWWLADRLRVPPMDQWNSWRADPAPVLT